MLSSLRCLLYERETGYVENQCRPAVMLLMSTVYSSPVQTARCRSVAGVWTSQSRTPVSGSGIGIGIWSLDIVSSVNCQVMRPNPFFGIRIHPKSLAKITKSLVIPDPKLKKKIWCKSWTNLRANPSTKHLNFLDN